MGGKIKIKIFGTWFWWESLQDKIKFCGGNLPPIESETKKKFEFNKINTSNHKEFIF